EGSNVRRDSLIPRTHPLKPRPVVTAKRFSRCKPHQSRAIALVRIPFFTQAVELHFGDRGEPAPKVLPIVKGTQFSVVRDSVAIRIGRSVGNGSRGIIVRL